MKIVLAIEWWMIPSVLVGIGVLFLLLSEWKQKGHPKWITSECIILPNFKGTVASVLGVLCILLGLAFTAGHYVA